MTDPLVRTREEGTPTAALGFRQWEAVQATGPLGDAPGWTRVRDAEAQDALVFTGVDSVPLLVPRMTLHRYPWPVVHAGRWPDPTRADQRFLDLATEPYQRDGARGWTVLRAAAMQGRSVVERSWIFTGEAGVTLVRMRCPAELHLDMEVLSDSVVAAAPGISTSDQTRVIAHAPGGTRPLPGSVEVSPAGLSALLAAAGTDRPQALGLPPAEQKRLESAGLLDSDGALTRAGRWWARTHILAPRRWVLRREHPGASTHVLEMAVTGSGAAVHLANGAARWIGLTHLSRLPEFAARFVGIAPAPHRDLKVPIPEDAVRRRLSGGPQAEPPADGSTQFQRLWDDVWTRWVMAGSPNVPAGHGEPTSARQFIGTLHHGHFQLRPSAGDVPGSSRQMTLEAVPSSEAFALFCREMLGAGCIPQR